MAKSPAYPMYAQDFDMDTRTWTSQQVGIHIRLLNYAWMNGSIPKDQDQLMRLTCLDRESFEEDWEIVGKKWRSNGKGGLVNKRMEAERRKQRKFRKIQSEKGKKGAAAKHSKTKEKSGIGQTAAKAPASARPQPEGGLSSSSSPSSSPSGKEENRSSGKETTSGGVSCSDLPERESSPEADSEVLIKIPTNRFGTKGEEYPITEDQIAEWEKLYPAVDVMQELRKMRGWSLSNEAKRKTKRGMLRFATSWLSRAQDRGGSTPPKKKLGMSPQTIEAARRFVQGGGGAL